MNRYIPNLLSYNLDQLYYLYNEIDSCLEHPDQNSQPYTVGQYHLVKKLIKQKGGILND